MNISTFDELIRLVGPAVSYQNTNFRLCVPPEKRITAPRKILLIIVIFKLYHTKYLLNFDSGEELGAFIGFRQ
jgi:hypothetical protein